MKSQNGVTMFSLIIYVTSFLVITTLVAGITTFFYNNVEVLSKLQNQMKNYQSNKIFRKNEFHKVSNENVLCL